MKSVPLSEAKNTLSALVDEASREHEIIRITRHGQTAAVLMSETDLESLQETVFWLSQPGIRDDIAEADAALAAGETVSAADVRARFGLDPE
jgi:antitoxin YefM